MNVLIERAHARLLQDSTLTMRVVADLKADHAAARRDSAGSTVWNGTEHAETWRVLDADLKRDLASVSALTGGEQLLRAEDLASKWAVRAAAEKAAAEERAAKARADAHARVMEPMRERARADWAASSAASVLAALETLGHVAEEAARLIRGRRWHDDAPLMVALDMLAESHKALGGALASTRRDANRRVETAAAAAAAADTIARVTEIAASRAAA